MKSLTQSTIVAVIGAGTMGAGVAQVAAAAGHTVLLFDVQQGAAQKGRDGVGTGLQKLVTRGRITEQERLAIVDRIQVVDLLEDLSEAGLVIEAIVENLEIKQQLFVDLQNICGADCILASNTSSISITAIASALKHPEKFVGMHFFNPAPIMKLVEVVSGLATDPEIAQQLHTTAIAWGKKAVYAKSTPGFIVNRVARPFYAEALRVLQEQASDVATIDAIMRESGGFRMGPFELMDLIGHDVNFAVTQSVYSAYFYDPRFMPSLIQQELVLAGRLGRKSGHGFYDYAKEAAVVEASTTGPAEAPKQITIFDDLPLAETLIEHWQQAGIEVKRESAKQADWSGVIRVGSTHLALTDGRTATRRSAETGIENLVLFDLALDYKTATRMAICASDQSSEESCDIVAGLFQVIDKRVSVIADVAGMVVMRTVAMLANEGADAVNQGVCNAGDVDVAMQSGVNYPKGPLSWADELGVARVQAVLTGLAETYGEDRYRCSPAISRCVEAGRGFHA